MKKTAQLLCLVVGLLALSGCALLQGQELPDPTSDEGIAELASIRLNDDPMTARSTLSVTVEKGTAVLYGAVPDQTTRQRAIQILEGTPGIFDVRDRTRRQ